MKMMSPKCFFALFLIVSFEAVVAGDCTNEDFQKITGCYVEANNNMVPYLTDLVAPMFTLNVTKEYWAPICEHKKKLNDCIGKERIDRCFDIQNIMNLPFAPVESAAKVVIASFLEVDHNCENLFKLSDEDIECYQSYVGNVSMECKSVSFLCNDIMEAVNCTIHAAYDKCGKRIGCFNEKTATLQKCYVSVVCQNCNNLSAVNSPIRGLCNDDEVQKEVKGGKAETTPATPSSGKPVETTPADTTVPSDATTLA